jgi:hypothetical protein
MPRMVRDMGKAPQLVQAMKLPRWLVMCMLAVSAGAFLLLAASWWATWPHRTYREFHSLVRRGALEDARRLLRGPTSGVSQDPPLLGGMNWSVMYTSERGVVWLSDTGTAILDVESEVAAEARTIADLLLGRATFKTGDGLPELEFTAERGKLRVVAAHRKPRSRSRA